MNDQNEHDNGRKRGFGPHGEGCECDELIQGHVEPVEEKQAEPQAEPEKPPRLLFSLRHDPNDLTEMMFSAVADAYSQAITDLLLYLDFDGVPLNERQVVRLYGALMRGHATAKSAAETVQQNYMMIAMRARAAAQEDAPAEEPPAEEGHGLRDVADLFTEGPQE